MCLVSIPTLSSAATINILSEQLVVNLKVQDDTYTYTGSAFKAPNWNQLYKKIVLPNSTWPSYFLSTYWWNAYQTGSGFSFLGSAYTSHWIRDDADYDPSNHVYTSSVVAFYMLFSVEGDGARLSANTLYDSNSSIAIMDLTTGTLFSGGTLDLLSGHQYHVAAWSRSINGSGDEYVFELYLGGVQAAIPDPSAP